MNHILRVEQGDICANNNCEHPFHRSTHQLRCKIPTETPAEAARASSRQHPKVISTLSNLLFYPLQPCHMARSIRTYLKDVCKISLSLSFDRAAHHGSQ